MTQIILNGDKLNAFLLSITDLLYLNNLDLRISGGKTKMPPVRIRTWKHAVPPDFMPKAHTQFR